MDPAPRRRGNDHGMVGAVKYHFRRTADSHHDRHPDRLQPGDPLAFPGADLPGCRSAYRVLHDRLRAISTTSPSLPYPCLFSSPRSSCAFRGDTDAFDMLSKSTSRLPGGLAVAARLTCTLFASVCGAGTATAAAVGSIAVPEMINRGYDKRLTCGSIAAGGPRRPHRRRRST